MKKIFLSFLLLILLGFQLLAQENSVDTVLTKQISDKEKPSLLTKVIDWYSTHLNYGTITLLMAIESSFIPFPSEVVVPPAAYVACDETSGSTLYMTDSEIVNVLLVILFATLGAMIGALINYFLALFLGRPIIYWFADSKLGRLFLLNSEKIKKAEDYFVKHGNISTFVGRLVPGIRQLISIPAGLAKMKFAPFLLYTFLGAGIWNAILAVLGYIAHGQKDIIDEYSHILSYILLALVGIGILYFIIKAIVKKRRKAKTSFYQTASYNI